MKVVDLYHYFFIPFFFCSFNHGESEYTFTTSVNELLNWDPPTFIQEKFPYFLSGYDHKKSPVWVIQLGKWDIRQHLEKYGDKYNAQTTKYIEQICERFSSPELFSIEEVEPQHDPAHDFIFVVDLKGFKLEQLSHTQTVQKFRLAYKILLSTLRQKNYNYKKGYMVNSNYFFQMLWAFLKPQLGRLNGVELYGTNPDKFKAALLRNITKDQLPPSLGGLPGFIPVKYYG